MKALWQIILAILWRLRPVQALEANLAHIIQLCLGMFSDEDAIDDPTFDPAYSQTIAAAFFDAHRKVDLLIYMRGCEIAGIRPRIDSFKPDFSWTHSSTNLIALWRSFQRLAAKFADYERYAQRRAERLKREDTTLCPSLRDSPLRLDATHRSTSPGFAGGGLTTHTALEVLPRQRRGRWHARVCAHDGGGCALARGWLNATGPPMPPNPPTQPHTTPVATRQGSPQLDQNPAHWPAQPMRLILAAAFAALVACSDKPPEPATPASGAAAIISAERDFASDATRMGWVEAFGQWSAPDAVLLGQGPEPASQFLANIDPANRKDTSLHWAPEFAGASAAGDFGFTAGPFNGDGSTFGYYLTVWRQQPDGEWRWLYNGGVDTRTPTTIDPAFNVALIDPTSGGEGAADVAKTAIDILEAGLATSAASDAHVSLSSQFAANARMHRADTPPIIGDEAITKAIEAGPQTIDFKQLQSFAATGGDMVFTLGEARWKNDVLPDGTGTDAFGIYNRVWSSTGDGWRIVFDQIVPRDLPPNPQQ